MKSSFFMRSVVICFAAVFFITGVGLANPSVPGKKDISKGTVQSRGAKIDAEVHDLVATPSKTGTIANEILPNEDPLWRPKEDTPVSLEPGDNFKPPLQGR